MDMSVVKGEEKPVNVNEVPEYAAEIYTYLREMEVRNAHLSFMAKKLLLSMFFLVISDALDWQCSPQ